ncbi:hypothetical protein HMPREF0239_03445, partial [Clostridium sp. ATCC BAA-442]
MYFTAVCPLPSKLPFIISNSQPCDKARRRSAAIFCVGVQYILDR